MMIYLLISGTIAISGMMMIGLTLLFRSEYGTKNRIRDGKHGSAAAKKFTSNAVVNSIFSLSTVYGLTYLLAPYLYHEGTTSIFRVIWEGVAILLVYDFFYYLVHRYPFHKWRILRGVHAVHHVVRNPSAIDSLYLHPLETFLGLALLWACTGLVAVIAGPVSVYSFGWTFLVYSTLNVVVHSGLKMRIFPASIATYLATRHDKHHANMKAKNFASVTPLWDYLLGTREA
jgi:sterol desaturase/sphingolipid hydroxylase (fatty acid hydroxylase superfamily)